MELEVYERDEACIQVCSILNDGMDCVFFVSRKDKEEALRVLEKAWDDFWEQSCEPYGDFLTGEMKKAGISYEVYFKDSSQDLYIHEVQERTKNEDVRNTTMVQNSHRKLSQ